MKLYITSFNYIRYFKENIIPVGTTKWPFWIFSSANVKRDEIFVDNNNVVNGIIEECFTFPGYEFEKLDEQCQKDCPYKYKAPDCSFQKRYIEILRSKDIKKVYSELELIAEDVRKITHYEGEPHVALIVYEAPGCVCSEGPRIKQWFEENGYEIEYMTKPVIDSIQTLNSSNVF